MPSWQLWLMRIVLAASIALNLAFINRDMAHQSFVGSLLTALGLSGWMLVWRYREDAAQRRRTGAQQQASNAKEADAAGD